MRTELWLVAALLLLAALQTTLLGPMFLPAEFAPNLLLGMAVLLGLFHGNLTGLLLAWLSGYITDLNTGGLMGVYMGTRVIAFWVARTMSERIFVQSPMTVGLWAGIMAPVEVIIATVLYRVFSTGGWDHLSLGVLIGQAVTTTIGVALLHVPLRRLWVTPGETLLGRMD